MIRCGARGSTCATGQQVEEVAAGDLDGVSSQADVDAISIDIPVFEDTCMHRASLQLMETACRLPNVYRTQCHEKGCAYE